MSLKIAIIVNPLIPVPPEKYGGIERIVYMLIQELKSFGHDITLFAHPDSAAGCKLVSYTGSEYFNFKDFVKINAITAKIIFNQFDIVHTFGRMSNIALLMPSKLTKIISYQLPPTLSQIKKAIKLSRKNSLHFTGCSDFIANQIRTLTPTSTIYNGVNINDYTFSQIVTEDAPLFFLGRIQVDKGTHIAIDVAKRTNKKLIIAGNIPNEQIHQDYFKAYVEPFIDGEQIKYVGPVNDQQKNNLLGKTLAFLMPVTWDEPFGIVMVEALACGTPVIGFRRGALPEVIEEGINGFVCDGVTDMVNAVHKVDKISRKACRDVASEKFSSTKLAKQYEHLYLTAITQ
ncbi:glycosyltransferase family 4 protein [Pedobacter agri]|uniref:glycosyltransferase family 4 protein n=1 Tax=Pedobacter agri TaxID=454586 RepID=UPI00292CEF5D|nr:glycosyltransferase family 4 protein [Pedobacter agri]